MSTLTYSCQSINLSPSQCMVDPNYCKSYSEFKRILRRSKDLASNDDMNRLVATTLTCAVSYCKENSNQNNITCLYLLNSQSNTDSLEINLQNVFYDADGLRLDDTEQDFRPPKFSARESTLVSSNIIDIFGSEGSVITKQWLLLIAKEEKCVFKIVNETTGTFILVILGNLMDTTILKNLTSKAEMDGLKIAHKNAFGVFSAVLKEGSIKSTAKTIADHYYSMGEPSVKTTCFNLILQSQYHSRPVNKPSDTFSLFALWLLEVVNRDFLSTTSAMHCLCDVQTDSRLFHSLPWLEHMYPDVIASDVASQILYDSSELAILLNESAGEFSYFDSEKIHLLNEHRFEDLRSKIIHILNQMILVKRFRDELYSDFIKEDKISSLSSKELLEIKFSREKSELKHNHFQTSLSDKINLFKTYSVAIDLPEHFVVCYQEAFIILSKFTKTALHGDVTLLDYNFDLLSKQLNLAFYEFNDRVSFDSISAHKTGFSLLINSTYQRAFSPFIMTQSKSRYFDECGLTEDVSVALTGMLTGSCFSNKLIPYHNNGTRTRIPKFQNYDHYHDFLSSFSKSDFRGCRVNFTDEPIGELFHLWVDKESNASSEIIINKLEDAQEWCREILDSKDSSQYVVKVDPSKNLVDSPFHRELLKFTIISVVDDCLLNDRIRSEGIAPQLIVSNDLDSILTFTKEVEGLNRQAVLEEAHQLNITENWYWTWYFPDNEVTMVPCFLGDSYSSFQAKITGLLEKCWHLFGLKKSMGHPRIDAAPMVEEMRFRFHKKRDFCNMTSKLTGARVRFCLANYHRKIKGHWPELESEEGLPDALANHKFVQELRNRENMQASNFELDEDILVICSCISFKPYLRSLVNFNAPITSLNKDKAICSPLSEILQKTIHDLKSPRFQLQRAAQEAHLSRQQNANYNTNVKPDPSLIRFRTEHQIPEPSNQSLAYTQFTSDRKIAMLNESPVTTYQDAMLLAEAMVAHEAIIAIRESEKEREVKSAGRLFAVIDPSATIIVQIANNIGALLTKASCPEITSGKSKAMQSKFLNECTNLMNERSPAWCTTSSSDISKFCTSLRKVVLQGTIDALDESIGEKIFNNSHQILGQSICALAEEVCFPIISTDACMSNPQINAKLKTGGPNDIKVGVAQDKELKEQLVQAKDNLERKRELLSDYTQKKFLTRSEAAEIFTGQNIIWEPSGFCEGLLQSVWTTFLSSVSIISGVLTKTKVQQFGSGDNQVSFIRSEKEIFPRVNNEIVTAAALDHTVQFQNVTNKMLSLNGLDTKAAESLMGTKSSFYLKTMIVSNHVFISPLRETLRASLCDSGLNPDLNARIAASTTNLNQRLASTTHPMAEMMITSAQNMLGLEIFGHKIPLINTRRSSGLTPNKHHRQINNVHLLQLKGKKWLAIKNLATKECIRQKYEIAIMKRDGVIYDKSGNPCEFVVKPESGVYRVFLLMSMSLHISPFPGSPLSTGPYDKTEKKLLECIESLYYVLRCKSLKKYHSKVKNTLANIQHYPETETFDELSSFEVDGQLFLSTPPNPKILDSELFLSNLKENSSPSLALLISKNQALLEEDLPGFAKTLLLGADKFAPVLMQAVMKSTLHGAARQQFSGLQDSATTSSAYIQTALDVENQLGRSKRLTRSKQASSRRSGSVNNPQRDLNDEDLFDLAGLDDQGLYDGIQVEDDDEMSYAEQLIREKDSTKRQMLSVLNYLTLGSAIATNLICRERCFDLAFSRTGCDFENWTIDRYIKKFTRVMMVNSLCENKKPLIPMSESYRSLYNMEICSGDEIIDTLSLSVIDKHYQDETKSLIVKTPPTNGTVRIMMDSKAPGLVHKISGDCQSHYLPRMMLTTVGAKLCDSSALNGEINSCLLAMSYLSLLIKDDEKEFVMDIMRNLVNIESVEPYYKSAMTGTKGSAHRMSGLTGQQTINFLPYQNNIYSFDSRGIVDTTEKGHKMTLDVMTCITHAYLTASRLLLKANDDIRDHYTINVEIQFTHQVPEVEDRTLSIKNAILNYGQILRYGQKHLDLYQTWKDYAMNRLEFTLDTMVPSDMRTGRARVESLTSTDAGVYTLFNAMIGKLFKTAADDTTHKIPVVNCRVISSDNVVLVVLRLAVILHWLNKAKSHGGGIRQDSNFNNFMDTLSRISDVASVCLENMTSLRQDGTTDSLPGLDLRDVHLKGGLLKFHICNALPHSDIVNLSNFNTTDLSDPGRKLVIESFDRFPVFHTHMNVSSSILAAKMFVLGISGIVQFESEYWRIHKLVIRFNSDVSENGLVRPEFIEAVFDTRTLQRLDFGPYNHEGLESDSVDILEVWKKNDAERTLTFDLNLTKTSLFLEIPLKPLPQSTNMTQFNYATIGESLLSCRYLISGENGATESFASYILTVLRTYPEFADVTKSRLAILGSGLGYLHRRLAANLEIAPFFILVDRRDYRRNHTSRETVGNESGKFLEMDVTILSSMRTMIQNERPNVIIVEVEEDRESCHVAYHVVTKTIRNLSLLSFKGLVIIKTKGSNIAEYLASCLSIRNVAKPKELGLQNCTYMACSNLQFYDTKNRLQLDQTGNIYELQTLSTMTSLTDDFQVNSWLTHVQKKIIMELNLPNHARDKIFLIQLNQEAYSSLDKIRLIVDIIRHVWVKPYTKVKDQLGLFKQKHRLTAILRSFCLITNCHNVFYTLMDLPDVILDKDSKRLMINTNEGATTGLFTTKQMKFKSGQLSAWWMSLGITGEHIKDSFIKLINQLKSRQTSQLSSNGKHTSASNKTNHDEMRFIENLEFFHNFLMTSEIVTTNVRADIDQIQETAYEYQYYVDTTHREI